MSISKLKGILDILDYDKLEKKYIEQGNKISRIKKANDKNIKKMNKRLNWFKRGNKIQDEA